MSDKEPSESKELEKMEKLTPNSREVNIIVKVVSKSEVRNVTGRDYSTHRVADALVGDETGCVILTLFLAVVERKIKSFNHSKKQRLVSLYDETDLANVLARALNSENLQQIMLLLGT